MVVVVIIGVLSTVVTISVTDYLVSAKQEAARSEIATICNALALHFMEEDRFPSSEEGLAALKKSTPRHPTGILNSDTKDPWGRDYIYICPGVQGPYDLLTYGADGLEGGTGANSDIVSWNLKRER
jgi:general secretion pathway protein G